jgi:hypothetical protein
MRKTRIMLAVVITLIITYITLGLFHFLLSTCTFRESLISRPVVMVMFVIGWIPAVIVGHDVAYDD